MPFHDRDDAGRRLAELLQEYAGQDVVILALPRGGVPIAATIAATLHAPVDLILVRKIGVPYQPELAMGAVAEGSPPVVERDERTMRLAGVDAATFERVLTHELREIDRRRQLYLSGRERISAAGKIAIVVDDGLATGATARAALAAVRQQNPRRLVLAVPVAASETVRAMRTAADEIICIEEHEPFHAIGLYYGDFRQVSDGQVQDILARFPPGSDDRLARSGPARDADTADRLRRS